MTTVDVSSSDTVASVDHLPDIVVTSPVQASTAIVETCDSVQMPADLSSSGCIACSSLPESNSAMNRGDPMVAGITNCPFDIVYAGTVPR